MRKGGLPADETTAAVRYQTEAVSILSKRLRDSVAKGQSLDVSDGTIGAVSGLICNAVSRYPRYLNVHWCYVPGHTAVPLTN